MPHSVLTTVQAEMAVGGGSNGGHDVCHHVKQQNTLIFEAAGSLFPDHGARRTGWREWEVLLSNCLLLSSVSLPWSLLVT